jgi:hypothetical protein
MTAAVTAGARGAPKQKTAPAPYGHLTPRWLPASALPGLLRFVPRQAQVSHSPQSSRGPRCRMRLGSPATRALPENVRGRR